MYVVYITNQIHQLFNEFKKWAVSDKKDYCFKVTLIIRLTTEIKNSVKLWPFISAANLNPNSTLAMLANFDLPPCNIFLIIPVMLRFRHFSRSFNNMKWQNNRF
jgi:hypothetical protein